ncbi:MAG: PAS domain S-box protein [Candidatus Latescibacteria bacterium]|jgi:PAS domain S-box-containing protein|nr:PAS domain S-box protein [Candidatus Latescibacterota bacterium]
MNDKNKTRTQLISELVELRQRVDEREEPNDVRRRVKKELNEKQTTLEKIINLNPYSMSIYDSKGHYILGNQAFMDLFGIESMPQEYSLFNDPVLKRMGLHKMMLELKKGKAIYPDNYIWYNLREFSQDLPDKDVCIRGVGFPIINKDGNVESIVIMLEDITEWKRAEDALKESEEKYRKVIENIYDIVYSSYADGKIYFISPNVLTLTGYKPEEIIGHNIIEFVHPDDREHVISDYKKTIQTGEEYPTLLRLSKKDGSYFYVEDFGKVVREGNKIVGVTGVLRDITERKQAENTLKESVYVVRTFWTH